MSFFVTVTQVSSLTPLSTGLAFCFWASHWTERPLISTVSLSQPPMATLEGWDTSHFITLNAWSLKVDHLQTFRHSMLRQACYSGNKAHQTWNLSEFNLDALNERWHWRQEHYLLHYNWTKPVCSPYTLWKLYLCYFGNLSSSSVGVVSLINWNHCKKKTAAVSTFVQSRVQLSGLSV